MIKVERKNGNIEYTKQEIIIFIEEQLKMIPGVVGLKKKSPISLLRNFLNLSSGSVKVYQINVNELCVELSLLLNKDVNYKQIEEEIHKVLKYSMYKKYGLSLGSFEIHIQDLV